MKPSCTRKKKDILANNLRCSSVNIRKKMKKILFVLPSYRYGGTMTSFKNLLLLIHKDYDIHVKAIVNEGDAYDFVSQYSQVLDHRVTETTLVARCRQKRLGSVSGPF